MCKDLSNQNWKTYIAPKEEVLIGDLIFLNDWIIRSETSDALGKIFANIDLLTVSENFRRISYTANEWDI